MNEGIDPIVLAWLGEGPERSPDELLERSLLATRRTRQRRWWAVPSHWLPDRVTNMGRSRMSASIAMLIVAALLVLAVVAALMVAGSQRRLPPPVGPAANGELAYDTGPGGIIYISNADGSGVRPLVGEVGVQRAPIFSPDGTKIAFWRRIDDEPKSTDAASACECPDFELWVANADGSHPHKVSGDLAFDVNPAYNANWSPDGRNLVFHSETDGVDLLYTVAADGSQPPVAITGRDASRWGPVWSPNGKWIAFGMLTPGDPPMATTGVIRPDGTDMRTFGAQLLPDDAGAYAESLTWSPDSTRFAFARGNDDTVTPEKKYWAFLDVVDVRDGTQSTVYEEWSGWLHVPQWSPDGSSIALMTGEILNSLALLHLDTGKRDLIKQCEGMNDYGLVWSPDGRSIIAFCKDQPYLIPLDHPGNAVAMSLPSGATGMDWQRIAR